MRLILLYCCHHDKKKFPSVAFDMLLELVVTFGGNAFEVGNLLPPYPDGLDVLNNSPFPLHQPYYQGNLGE